MTLVIGFALVAAGWVLYAYGRDMRACAVELWLYVTHGAPERIERDPWMRAMDELGRGR